MAGILCTFVAENQTKTKMKKYLLTLIVWATSLACASAAESGEAPVINNDTFWKTTSGTYIYSQGGGIFRFPDAQGVEHYYWYGVKYQEAVDYCPKALAGSQSNITNFLSVTCYRSDDLVNWTFVKDVLTPSSTGWAYWVGRLGVAYIPEAKKYALLTQFNDNVLVATCDSPTGDFQPHNQIDMTDIIGTPNTGDQTVFTDPDTGKSYLCYSYGKGRNKIYLSEIGVCPDGKIGLKDCHQIYKGSGREGDCMFKYKGKYYVCASDLYGWNASNVYYLEASDIYGPYTPTNSMQVMPGSADDYGHVTQTGFFYTVRGTNEETVIYCGDRWAGFAGNGNGFNQWCPISFVDGKPYFNSLSQWHLDAETGKWYVGKDNNYVKNFSFDADRVFMPSANKPAQDFLRGWKTVVSKGNKVAIGDENSPVLNANNSSSDRATVMGNKCLNISDKVDFQRKVYQTITSSPYVPLPDGNYTMTAYAKVGSMFNELYMYASSGGQTFKADISAVDGQWHLYSISDVTVVNGTVEVGFYADGQADMWCHIDDVTLVMNSSSDNDDADKPIVLTSAPETQGVSYMDGSMTFYFNQNIKYVGNATISGNAFERITNVTTAGSALIVSYEGLNVNTDYKMSFPMGSLTNQNGSKVLEENVEFCFSTCDFGLLENIKDTHKGRAAPLPINFKPFDVTGLLERENGTVQEGSNEHPHWVQVSGEKNSDRAVFTKTSDKIMTFFQTASPAMRVKADYSGNGYVEFKLQETRNADVTPGWRTIRVLRAEDFPFDEVIPLNSNARFIKLVAPVLSGSVTVSEFRVADANGEGLHDTDGIDASEASDGNAPYLQYYSLSGNRIAAPSQGICLMRMMKGDGTVVVKKIIQK